MILLQFLGILISCVVLIKGTDLTIIAIKRISEQTKIGTFAVSAIILAIGTSFPELSVGITSAIGGESPLSFGTVIGSNISNLSLVLGLAGLSVGKIFIRGHYLEKDFLVALAAGLAPLIFILDGEITRSDGVILLAIYFAYTMSFFRERYIQIGKGDLEVNRKFYRFLRKIDFNLSSSVTRNALRLVLGVAMLIISSSIIVSLGKSIAVAFGIPVFVVGLIVVAVGTSLPELAFSFRSLRDHEPSLFFGNILGSTIANSTLIIGIVALISPITQTAVETRTYATVFFVLIAISVWLFSRTKRRVDWWESFLLVCLYAIFVVLEVFSL